ncbi:MAG: TolC family protein [Candidatus Omnitrophota bacterium]
MRKHTLFKLISFGIGAMMLAGCSSPGKYREKLDQTAYKIIEQKQMEALGRIEPFSLESPEESLRKKLMLDQMLPYSSPASLSAKDIEAIPFWPKDDYWKAQPAISHATLSYASEPLRLKLLDALQVAAKNNQEYRSRKEDVFLAALNLDLTRDRYRNTFSGSLSNSIESNLGGNKTTNTFTNSESGGFSRQLLNGVGLSARIGFDLIKMLNPFDKTDIDASGDASITIPLLRGSGKHIFAENLTQAERNAVYAIYTFERYKRTFAVSIASEYLSVLQAIDQIDNAEANYQRSITYTRLMRRQADAGKKSPIEVDQTIQDELSARNGWISAQISYQNRLDSLKMSLGLPPDANIELDGEELTRLTESTKSISQSSGIDAMEKEVPAADAPVELRPLTQENAGPMELDVDAAIQLALDNRLDLRASIGRVYDAQRKLVVAADDLRAELTLLGSAKSGGDLNFEKGRYNALLTLDLPIERTQEIKTYRERILDLEQASRDLQDTEDSIKLSIRSRLRTLQDARASLQIQAQAVNLAQRRVTSTNLSLQAGRVIIRDVLEAQRALLSSQNSLTSAMVRYRIAELELQRDLDVLLVDENGMWKEYSPQELKK